MNAIAHQTHALSTNPATGETVGSSYENESKLDAVLNRRPLLSAP